MNNDDRYAKMSMPCVEIGRALACSFDDDQAAVFNSFAKELMVVCRDQDLTGMQVCSMAEKLDANGKRLVAALKEFIELREDAEKRAEK